MTLLQHELTDFKVNAFQNNEFHEVTKDDVLGHWSLFFFYPADFTFVCPTELEDLAKNYAKFKEIGCEIYSVSCDTHFVHKAWHDANEKIAKIEYPMLADPTALLRGHLLQRGPQRRGAAAPRAGLPVRLRARRPGLPRQLDPWRGNHRAQPRPRRPAVIDTE